MASRSRRRPAPPPKPAAPPRLSDFDRTFWLAVAVLVPVTLLAYEPAWHGGLLWDDDGHITKAALRSIGGIWRIWFEPGATQQYYPVVHSAFWLQWHLWGTHTIGYHLVNILLHATSAALLIAILRRLGVKGALIAGALFAWHPVQVESVAWITELKNTLSGTLYFAAALVYLHFDERRNRPLYWSALGLFVLALFSKSVTATLPFALMVVFWWRHGRLDWQRDVRPLAPWVVVGVAAGAMTIWMERTYIGAEGAPFDFTLIERTLIAGRAVCFYLASLVWPVNLVFSYPRWHVSQAAAWQYVYPAIVAAALALLWLLRGRTRAPLATLLFFGITLGPALGFVNVYPFVYSFVADHFQYLACAGVFAFAGGGLMSLAERRGLTSPAFQAGLALVLAAPLVFLTWRDAHAYASSEVLYQTTLERNPDSLLAHNNLAALYLDATPPDPARALIHAREAVRVAPERAAAHFNLGLALEASGDQQGALDAFHAAIDHATEAERDSPRIARAHEGLARVLRSLGRLEESAAEYALAAAKAPESSDTEINAGIALLQAGQTERAVQQLLTAVAKAPGRPEAHYTLGLAYEKLGQIGPAIEQFQATVTIAPSHVDAQRHLGQSLHSAGRRPEAIAAYEAALALDPASADTHNDLGVALAELGRFREAEPHFAEALRLAPDDEQAKANLARTRQILKRDGGGDS